MSSEQLLQKTDILCLTNYVWNQTYNDGISMYYKKINPNGIVLYGGASVPEHKDYAQSYAQDRPYVDLFFVGPGEITLKNYLKNIDNDITTHEGTFSQSHNNIVVDKSMYLIKAEDIPDPYILGIFDEIINNIDKKSIGITFESTRGCPFRCSFCDWGSLTYAKVKKFPEEKVYQEIEWLGANKIEYIFMADANFGIFPDRDMAITDYILDVQARTGYPATVNANWHKNSKQNVIEIVKKFISNGFNRGMTLSVQSMDDDVLKIIKRKNMQSSHLGAMMDLLNSEGIGSYTELILPLPGETTETWRNGLAQVLDIGQHNSIEIWFHQILENAQSNQPDHKNEFGFDTVKLPDYVMGDPEPDHQQHISEVTEVVCSTNTMTYDEFLDCWMYAWMIINFHVGGWSQVITRYNDKQQIMAYKTAYERLYAAICNDDGICGAMYKKTRKMLDNYLQNNELSDGASGHTLFWFANRTLHKHHNEVMDFILGVFGEENTQLGNAQRYFVTNIDNEYPINIELDNNYYEFISSKDTELTNKTQKYSLNVEKNWNSDQQYIEWLYFRRRQGFGKCKWSEMI